MRYILFRWSIFFIILLCIYSFINTEVKKIAQDRMTGAAVEALPAYTQEELLNDVQTRFRYIFSRTRGVGFLIYKVKMRDNLWKIAKKYHYSVHTIIGCNPQLKTYNVNVGQFLLLPLKGGCLHPVSDQDTWESIAERYEIDVETLKQVNYIAVDNLQEAKYIFVLGRRPAVDLMNEDMQEKYALRDLFRSPLAGRLSSTFGTRRHPVTGKISKHGGIDIAVKEGTLVAAAADGVVTVAGSGVGHYGTAVFIDHKNGYITHYGHLSRCLVRIGQKVKQGQIIARSGSTGRSTGPHLHFTVKKKGVSIDPLKFLW